MLATLTFPPIANPRGGRRRETVHARSAEDLRRALRAARERALSLDTSALNCLLRVDGRREQLECQAATPCAAVAASVGARGLPLEAGVRAAGLAESVGDAVSRNAPGPDGVPIVRHVEAITVVTADGELRRADRESNTDLFRLAVGGYGLFGVLYSITLRIDSLLHAARHAQAPAELDLAEPGTAHGALRSAEFLVPPDQLERTLAGFRALAAERRLLLQRILVRRLHAENETYLRWADREWAGVTLHYRTRATLGASVFATEIEAILLEIALSLGGSFPIADAHVATLPQLLSCYPKLAAFVAEKRRFDPAERLQNRWYRRISALLRRELRPAAGSG